MTSKVPTSMAIAEKEKVLMFIGRPLCAPYFRNLSCTMKSSKLLCVSSVGLIFLSELLRSKPF